MGKAVDIFGQKFGKLTAIEPTDKRVDGKIVWRCVCSCGNEVFATAKDLRSGNTKSCGCLNYEPRPTPSDVAFGTRISALGSNPPKNNTSGVRGVSWSRQKQDWEAYIKFRGKFYPLGHYKSIEDAAKARAAAEEKFYLPAKEDFCKDQKG